MTNLQRAMTIEGWMSAEELTWLWEHAKNHKVTMEIGSWHGRSTEVMLAATEATLAVDHWNGDSRISHYCGKNFPARCRAARENFFQNHTPSILTKKLRVVEADTQSAKGVYDVLAAVRELPSRPTMIFIDAAHNYPSVWNDIHLALEVMAPGALICGHDYYEQAMPGLVDAVKELLPHFQLGAGSLWYAQM